MTILLNWSNYDDLKHRYQTLVCGPNLAGNVLIFGPQGNTESELAGRYETAHVKLQIQNALLNQNSSLKDMTSLLSCFIFMFNISPWKKVTVEI